MRSLHRSPFVFLCNSIALFLLAGEASVAQSTSLSAEGTIYGRPYVAIGYDVKATFPSRSDEPWFPSLYNPPIVELVLEPPSLRPEALAFRGGLLYVGGDWNETQNQIGVFSTNSWGEIEFDHVIELPLSNPPPVAAPNNQWWGPEGLTFDTGATGIGAGGDLLVSIDDQQAAAGGDTFATIDRVTGVQSNRLVIPTADDIAFGPSTGLYFVLVSTPNSIHVYSGNMVATGLSWPVPPRARGLTVVSASFGRQLTGDMTLTGDILLVVCKEDVGVVPAMKNRLVAYRSDGTQIGAIQDVSWIDASLDNSSNGGTTPGPHEMEAIVVDEASGVIYIGDEAARAIYSIKAVTTETATVIGSLLGQTWQARGHYVEVGLPSRSGEPWYASLAGQVNNPPKLRPEGLAFRNGLLYVSGDWNETQNQIGVFTAGADGTLTYSSSISLPIGNPPPSPSSVNNTLWGPEGLTFNTGTTGYGASASALVTVEDAQYLLGGNTRCLINPITGVSSDFGTFASVVGAVSPDDISYGPALNRFYVLGDPDILQIWTTTHPPTYTGSQFALPLRSKGVSAISAEFARFLTGNPTLNQESLLVVAKGQVGSNTAPHNRLYVLSTTGAVLAQQDMLWTRDAFPGQALQEFEAIAVDEANRVVYIGDEKAGGIISLTLPSPLSITTPSTLPGATESSPYNQSIAANGGTPPYTFSHSGGMVPGGIALSPAGVLNGAPQECGVFAFNIEVMDATLATDSQAFSLTVMPFGPAGDMDESGTIDSLDIQRFTFALVGTGTAADDCAADLNADFLVNESDVAPFIAAVLAN